MVSPSLPNSYDFLLTNHALVDGSFPGKVHHGPLWGGLEEGRGTLRPTLPIPRTAVPSSTPSLPAARSPTVSTPVLATSPRSPSPTTSSRSSSTTSSAPTPPVCSLSASSFLGVGDFISYERSKRVMALRINVLAKGNSGISRETLERAIGISPRFCVISSRLQQGLHLLHPREGNRRCFRRSRPSRPPRSRPHGRGQDVGSQDQDRRWRRHHPQGERSRAHPPSCMSRFLLLHS